MAKSFLGRGFKFPFQVNGVGGIAMSQGEDNIEECVQTIIGTAIGERIMRPYHGCRIHDYVFHPNSSTTAGLVRFYVREALLKLEPRISNISVDANPDEDKENLMMVSVSYRVRSTNVDQNLVYPFYLRREQDL